MFFSFNSNRSYCAQSHTHKARTLDIKGRLTLQKMTLTKAQFFIHLCAYTLLLFTVKCQLCTNEIGFVNINQKL